MLRQYELVERIKRYDPEADEAMINRAYVFSVQKHGSQKRASGDQIGRHTSELQSLMRISYAVFCLKKKTQITNKTAQRHAYYTTTQLQKTYKTQTKKLVRYSNT